MKTYKNIEEVKADIKDGVLKVYDDIEIAFDGFNICVDIICKNIYSKDYPRNITARNINAGNINAGNINAWDINAGDIIATDIIATDIKAYEINARDINYYAVCSAYADIKCKSIKGRRANSKHFCLDREITIIEDEKIETIEIAGHKYSKKEVEEALKNIKELEK